MYSGHANEFQVEQMLAGRTHHFHDSMAFLTFKTLLILNLVRALTLEAKEIVSEQSPGGAGIQFCFHGRQKFEISQCPHGLHFHEPQNLECLYSFGEVKARIYSQDCSLPFTISSETAFDTNVSLVPITIKAQLIELFTPEAFETLENEGPELVDWVNMGTCFEECFEDSVENDPISVSGRDFQVERKVEKEISGQEAISNKTRQFFVDQTLRLGDYLFQTLNTLNSDRMEVRDGLDFHIVEIFRKSVRIMASVCHHPFLHSDFVNRMAHGFLFLVHDFGMEDLTDLTLEESTDILEALTLCQEHGPSFQIDGLICRSKAIVQSTARFSSGEMNRSHGSLSTYKKYPLEKYDLFIESAWRFIDAVHGMCFTTFRPNVNMHHRYVGAMEMLFNQKMQERWLNPTDLEKVSDWSLWFLVDMQTTMDNLQHCVEGAYVDAPFMTRLDRPVDKKLKTNEETQLTNIIIMGESGFYEEAENSRKWPEYQKKAGISEVLKSYATCFTTIKEKQEILEKQQTGCTNDDYTSDE